ncbi:MAG TPA: hypothetical protein VHT96_16805 [Clostridia bacterium]|nr:hypothetical protein [Clostridia bacterium]
MSFIDSLYAVTAVSVAAERATEVFKPIYLRFKNKLFKTNAVECTKPEKVFMSMIFGVLISIAVGIGIDIPLVNETVIEQEIFAGLISSFGSNVLHIVLSILTGVKDSRETRIFKH